MNSNTDNELEGHTIACRQLIAASQTLLLSTVTADGMPDISYAPYVLDEMGIFYIYVSDLATHTSNMLQSKKAAILFIKAETESPNLFARERASFRCSVTEVERDSPHYIEQLKVMAQQERKIVKLLSSLPDFHLLALTPESGRYVVGFGKAFTIAIDGFNLHPIRPDGG